METYKLVFYLVSDFYPHVASVLLPASLFSYPVFFWLIFLYLPGDGVILYNSLRGLRHAAIDPNQVWPGLPPHPLPMGQPGCSVSQYCHWTRGRRHWPVAKHAQLSFIDTHLQVLLLFSPGINYTSSVSRGRMVHLHLYQSRVHFSMSPPNGLQNKFQFWFPLSFQPN